MKSVFFESKGSGCLLCDQYIPHRRCVSSKEGRKRTIPSHKILVHPWRVPEPGRGVHHRIARNKREA